MTRERILQYEEELRQACYVALSNMYMSMLQLQDALLKAGINADNADMVDDYLHEVLCHGQE